MSRTVVNVTNEAKDFHYSMILASNTTTTISETGSLEVGWGDFGSYYPYGTAPVVVSGANIQGQVHTEISIAAGQTRTFYIYHSLSNIWKGYIWHNGTWVFLRSSNLGRVTCASCWATFENGNIEGANHPILPTSRITALQLWDGSTRNWTPANFSTTERIDQPYSATWTTRYTNWSAQGGP